MPFKDKEIAAEAKKKYRIENPEKVKEQQLKSRILNREARLLHSSKWNAFSRGLEHSICKEDIIIPEKCPYLNITLTNICGKGRHEYNPSLDRIDNTKGYVKGNIRVISDKANRLKTNLTEEELIIFAKGILKLHDNRG